MNSIEVSHLGKRYGDTVLFNDVSLTFPQQGFYVILGDSGSGKSTLLDLLAGIDCDYSGEILLFGHCLREKGEEDRSSFRLRQIGYLRQAADLLERESVMANVLLPLEATASLPRKLALRKARDLLSFLGLKDKEKQRANTLSGGEAQRVALARALINDPPILLCDEPTGALEEEAADRIYGYLREIARKRLVIVVSHDEKRSAIYAEHLLRLKDGCFTGADLPSSPPGEATLLTLENDASLAKPYPFARWLKHGYHLLKAKKLRSAFAVGMLAFALLSLGLSLYVKNDLSRQLNGAFGSLTGEGVVVGEKARQNEATFTRVISAPEEEVKNLARQSASWAYDYGLSYLADFESYFPDKNQGVIIGDWSAFVLPGFSLRSANDFLWLDCHEEQSYYPALPPLLEEEQVVLGLPYAQMVALCLSLHILRNYESLGRYLAIKPLDFSLQMANASWQYEDEQLLSIVAVTPSSVPTLYHYDHRWNSYLFEEKMRFPSADEPDASLPWILQKIFYLEPRGTPYEFMQEVRSRPELDGYLFERASFAYEQTHCRAGAVSDLGRFYVYLADKNALSPSLISRWGNDPAFSAFSVGSEGSYEAFPEALASGFAHPFFLSREAEGAESVIDALSSQKKETVLGEVSLPKDTVEGSYLKPLGNALSYSSDFRGLISGRIPEGEEEICLSRGLYEKWCHPEKVYGTGLVNQSEEGERLLNDYRFAELKVTGVVEESRDVLYAESYWTIDFFRDLLGMSAFFLEPTKVLFTLKDSRQSREVLSRLNAQYPAYRFIDPSLTVRSSIEQVVTYIELILDAASIVTLSLGVFLLLTIALLSVLENRREGRMLFLLGFRRGEIADCYGAVLCVLLSGSFLSSFFALLFAEVLAGDAIAKSFDAAKEKSLSLEPFAFMLLFAFCGLALAFLWVRNWVEKRNFADERR